jgi:conjugal transfer mating pair stabilization protein TraG
MARWITLCLGVVLVALPGLALADNIFTPGGGADTWTFYGYGNGYALAQILEAIKRMTDPASNPGFRNLTMVLSLVGFLALSFTGILSGSFHKIAFYFGGMLLTIYMLFSLKINIYVEDMVWDGSGIPQFSQQVQGVPAAIGLPAVVISEIGMWATRGVETNFTTPDFQNLRISEGAPVGMAASMLNDMRNIRLSDPYLRSSIQSFINDCALPNIFNGQISPVTLITSTNAWGVLGNNLNEAVYTAVYSAAEPRGEMYACDEAYASIDSRLQATAPALVSGMGDVSPFWLHQAAGDTTLSQAALEDSFRWASGGSVVQDATGLATQAAIAEMYSGTYEYAAMATGSSELISALNIEQARRAQQSGWYSTAILFRDMAGYFFAILQAFVIGLAPIVFAAILVPGLGRKMGTSYALVMTWLVLWWPGLAIVNYIMMLYFQGQTTGYISDGLTMANIGAVTEMSDKMVMASGFMSTLVPAIMWGLVSGSGYAFTSVLDRASGAQHAATAASSISTGAASAGQVSMNNANMNAHQTSHRYTSGNEVSAHHVGVASSMVTNLSGQDMNVGLRQADFRESHSASQAYSEATSRTMEAKEAFTQQSQRMLTDTLSSATQYAQDQGFVRDGSIDWSRMIQDQKGQQYALEVGALWQQMESAGFSREEIDEVTRQSSTNEGVEVGIDGRKGFSLQSGVSVYGSASVSRDYGTRDASSERGSSRESNDVQQATSGRLVFAENGQISVTGVDGERYSERLTDSESQKVLQARSGDDRASSLFAASRDYQEARQVQERAAEELVASRTGSVPTPVSPRHVDAMRSTNDEIRGLVSGQRAEDLAYVEGERGDITGAVGAANAGNGGRTARAENDTAPVRDNGVPGLSVAVGAGLSARQAGAQGDVETPDRYHMVDSGEQLAVVDRREIEAADNQNTRGLLLGGETTSLRVGNDTFVPVMYSENPDEPGSGHAIYAVEREGGHSYYRYGGDGSFEPVSMEHVPTQAAIDSRRDSSLDAEVSPASMERVQITEPDQEEDSAPSREQPTPNTAEDEPPVSRGPMAHARAIESQRGASTNTSNPSDGEQTAGGTAPSQGENANGEPDPREDLRTRP